MMGGESMTDYMNCGMADVRRYSIGDSARKTILARVISSGDDLTITIGGGDSPHVGAIALGVGRPPCAVIPKQSATVSSVCAYDHRDDELARLVARVVAADLQCCVCVSAGFHIDDASSDELSLIMGLAKRLCQKIVDGERGLRNAVG